MSKRLKVDASGRVVIPLAQRRRLGIEKGGEVELADAPDGLLLRRPDRSSGLRRDKHGLLTVSTGRPSTTEETLRAIREDRERRGRT